MMKPFYFVALAIAWVGAPCALAGPGTNAPDLDGAALSDNPVVVEGKGIEIRRRALDQALATARAQNPQSTLDPDAEIHAVTQLLEMQLVLQNATDEEKAEGRQKADQRMAYIQKSLSPAEFAARLEATHMTAEDLRIMLFQEETAQMSLTRQLGIHVTDADARKLFDSQRSGAYDQPARARVRELLLLTLSDFSTSASPPLPPATVQAKHEQIFKLYERVRAGEDFAALAKQYNEDPISKANDDELVFRNEQMAFGDLAFSMKPNQISPVLTNEDGYRIFQLLELIPAKKVGFEAIADRLKNSLIGTQKQMLAPAYLKQMRQSANVEILDSKLQAAEAANEAEAAAAAKAQAAFAARQAAATTPVPAAP
jgi:parvulin-like peptidyl-prolyl isomerase